MRQKLKKVSDNIFQECKSPQDKGGGLEWRRGFNLVGFVVSGLTLDHYLNVNDKDFSFSFSTKDEVKAYPDFKPKPEHKRIITGRALECRDRIHVVKPEEKESEFWEASSPAENIRILIKECGEYVRKDEYFPNGIYDGVLFYSANEGEDGDLCYELYIPSDLMDKIFEEFKNKRINRFQINVWVLSYTDRMDDSFRDPWMSRDILIEESTTALLMNIALSSNLSLPSVPQNEDIFNDVERNPVMAMPIKGGIEKAQIVSALNKFKLPLWIIAIAQILQLLLQS